MTFSTPVTPTRDRLSWTDGRRACTSVIGTLDEGWAAIASTYRVDRARVPIPVVGALRRSRSLDIGGDCGITPPRRIGRQAERGPARGPLAGGHAGVWF